MSKKELLLLFKRPEEPLKNIKGIQIEKYEEEISRRRDRNILEFSDILTFPKNANFSYLIPKHSALAAKLTQIFLDAGDIEELLIVAIFARENVNPFLFNYSLSIAILHKPELQDISPPSIIQCFPGKFFDSEVFEKYRETVLSCKDVKQINIFVPKDYTATDLEEEHRLAYFREDIGVNIHHWHWHLVYPHDTHLKKDRRGEFFYYMHQQIQARYNFERLSNNLKRVEYYDDFDKSIKEAYFPKLDYIRKNHSSPGRVANQFLKNVKREDEDINIDLDEMRRWRDRIYGVIDLGVARAKNRKEIELDEEKGIDILGNLVESSSESVNEAYYGNLHNIGHMVVAYIHDPDGRHLESFGVIGENTTAMRDPWFYRWHGHLNDIFQKFKNTLPAYSEEELDYPGINVLTLEVHTEETPNVFRTFWQESTIDITDGLNFTPTEAEVKVTFSHLQHSDFTYEITVYNNNAETKMGTCRIFLAPKFDETGKELPYNIQRTLFIELDKFCVELEAGKNTIMRKSIFSSVTTSFEKTFGCGLSEKSDFCGCGWPHYMLIPKGKAEKFACQLFVMISDYSKDKVRYGFDVSVAYIHGKLSLNYEAFMMNKLQHIVEGCGIDGQDADAASYCGVKNKLYPDRRSMGYPFDRKMREVMSGGRNTIQEFLLPNMAVQDVQIRFSEKQ